MVKSYFSQSFANQRECVSLIAQESKITSTEGFAKTNPKRTKMAKIFINI